MVGVVIVVVMLAAAGYAIWRNMSGGPGEPGNNRITTHNRGISGERGDGYRDGDLS